MNIITAWETIRENIEISAIQGGPDSISQFLIITNQSIQQHTGKWKSTFVADRWQRYFPIFPCVVGLIGY
jgi:hypothetical protein